MVRRLAVGLRVLVILTVLAVLAGTGWPDIREARAAALAAGAPQVPDESAGPQPAPAQRAMTLDERNNQVRRGLDATSVEVPADLKATALAASDEPLPVIPLVQSAWTVLPWGSVGARHTLSGPRASIAVLGMEVLANVTISHTGRPPVGGVDWRDVRVTWKVKPCAQSSRAIVYDFGQVVSAPDVTNANTVPPRAESPVVSAILPTPLELDCPGNDLVEFAPVLWMVDDGSGDVDPDPRSGTVLYHHIVPWVDAAAVCTPTCAGTGGFSQVTNVRGADVNTATGAYSSAAFDGGVAAAGIGFSLDRVYSSGDERQGSLGTGWRLPWETSLEVLDGGEVILHQEAGGQLRYSPGHNGAFTAPTGARSELRETASGYELTTPERRVLRYDEHGRVTFVGDRGGRGLSIAYQGDRPAVITDATGREHRLTHDGDRLVTVTLADGRTVDYAYASGLLTEVTGLDGARTAYSYNDDGRLASITGPDGHTRMELTYDSTGRVSSQRDAAGAVTTFAYEHDAGLDYAHATSPSGGIWTDVYGGNVLLAEIDPFGNITNHTYDAERNRTATEDALGNRTTYLYDSRGRLTSESSGSTRTTWRYSAAGLVSEIIDGTYRKTFLAYTDEGWLSGITDELNATTSLTYTDDGYLRTVTSPEGRTVTYEYDASGNRTATVLAGGAREERTYDSSGRLLTVTDPRGTGSDQPEQYTTSFTYDAADRVTSHTLPEGGTEHYTHDVNGQLVSFTDAEGSITEYAYDTAGRLVEITEPGGRVTSHAYDASGNLRQMTAPDGAKTTYTYDKADRPVSETRPRGNADGAEPGAFTWTFGYDEAGRPVTVTDPSGGTTERVFDNDGRVTKVTNPLGRTRLAFYDSSGLPQTLGQWAGGSIGFTYDKAGRPIRVNDPRNKNHHFTYDSDGNLTEQRSPTGAVTTYAYDANGHRVSMTDPRGNVAGADPADFTWHYAYDDAGLLTEITDPLGHTQRAAYNGNGQATALTDGLGNTTEYSYDATGRLTDITAPDGGTTAYAYSAAGDLAARTDANGHATRYAYDATGRLTSVTDPLDRVRELGYDLDGNLIRETNARGQTTRYETDPLGRVTAVGYSDDTPSVSIDYDAIGRITQVTDGTGTRDFPGLDWLGRPTLIDLPDGRGRLAYNYDTGGNVTRFVTEAYVTTEYGYNDDGHMVTARTRNQTTTYERDPVGNITAVTAPTSNGHSETRTYDAAGRLSAVHGTGPEGELSSWDITRDANGQPLRIDSVRAGEASRQLFTYDTNGRLAQECTTAADADSCPSGAATTDYTYDPVGNRLTEHTGGATTEYLFDAADQLTQALTGTATTDYGYDADGNLTSAGDDTFGYDAAGRLAWAGTPEGRFSYGYDADGNRTSASLDDQLLRTSVWDVVQPLPQLTADYDGSGRLISTYAYGADGRIQSGHRPSASAGFEQYHHDWIGSVADITDRDGTPQHRYSYSAFGITDATRLDDAAPANPFTFTGQYAEPTTDAAGLYPVHDVAAPLNSGDCNQ
jgi:YD repeat-containing protein